MSDLTNYNPSQREAVTFGEGSLLVLAGPGSGKTFTITQRILYLIHEKQIPPQKLLVITFTREAAVSMRQRFYRFLHNIPPSTLEHFILVFIRYCSDRAEFHQVIF